MRSGRVRKRYLSLPPLSKDEALKNTGHSMSIRNLIFGVNSVTVSYLIRYDSLLQNATDVITKCDSYFITKRDRSLLQYAPGFLLQNATVITKCDNYYKMRLLLQMTTVHILTIKSDKSKLVKKNVLAL